jgi:hypothetical protein
MIRSRSTLSPTLRTSVYDYLYSLRRRKTSARGSMFRAIFRDVVVDLHNDYEDEIKWGEQTSELIQLAEAKKAHFMGFL